MNVGYTGFRLLTVDSQRDLGLADSDPRDDGFAHVLTSIGLTHRLQIQLVAVTQNLEGVEGKARKCDPKIKDYMERLKKKRRFTFLL